MRIIGNLYKNELDVALESDQEILEKIGQQPPPATAKDLAYVMRFRPHLWQKAMLRWHLIVGKYFTPAGEYLGKADHSAGVAWDQEYRRINGQP